MSSCIKDLYEYDLVKKCSECGNISLKCKFHKDIKRSDGIFSACTLCRQIYRKKYYEENCDLEVINQRKYKSENQDKNKRYRFDSREKLKEC